LHPFLTLLKQEKNGFNNALNQGYKAATGEIVIKSDCTALPKPDAIREIVANFSDKSIGAVCGVHVFNGGNDSLEKEFKGVMYKVQIMESYFHSSLISHGSFGAYRKTLTPTLGEEITADDSEVVVNVVRHGFRAIIDPSVRSIEEIPNGFKERRSQKNRRAAGVIRVVLRNLDMLFNRKYGNFGLVTMPVDFFILVLSPILLFAACAFWAIYLIFNPTLTLLLSTTAIVTLICISAAISAKVRAIADTYISCFIGIFQSFSKKKTWK
jgi:cellulose synthase/poly-beta-1,6-N-acetylglucosamine synthase-like glycosyltransferase